MSEYRNTYAEWRREKRDYCNRMRAKYPGRRSLARALLSEILTAETESDRSKAAYEFACRNFRRGLKKLERHIAPMLEALAQSKDEWQGPPTRNELDAILFAIACMDTKRSHRRLAGWLTSEGHLLRADVLEMMAFEQRQYDIAQILPFADANRTIPEILSALYALQHRNYAVRNAEDAKVRLVPLLEHSYPGVRSYTIEILKDNPEFLEEIQALSNDPVPYVQEAVKEAVRG